MPHITSQPILNRAIASIDVTGRIHDIAAPRPSKKFTNMSNMWAQAGDKAKLPEDLRDKKAYVVIIDPQRSFCPLYGSTLGVPGANEDMDRLALLLRYMAPGIQKSDTTKDAHSPDHIGNARTWEKLNPETQKWERLGNQITSISFDDVLQGTVRWNRQPRGMGSAFRKNSVNQNDVEYGRKYIENLKGQVQSRYEALHAQANGLEDQGKSAACKKEADELMQLTVWPYHCRVGTSGYMRHPALKSARRDMKKQNPGIEEKTLLKGQVIESEGYSLVPLSNDMEVSGIQKAHQFARDTFQEWSEHDGPVMFAGEAETHCVPGNISDYIKYLIENDLTEKIANIVILKDCTSSVPGFDAQTRFYEPMEKLIADVEAEKGITIGRPTIVDSKDLIPGD